ncbi:helix-turn-helix transcriptional regulator [Streptomyces cinnabarinus]|uniref:Helix-turn-helix transcriptional regulator n=1 Tax=Streptomyces cinnabarinus TaxID=67287 RepID=A0ABY7KH22_9ACTN|nr:helix-turn-helix transcriptional regulator [Streptomyces cinnabarinus]WAZ23833.1 helix-turn-helix transcriptional regulator [Streptomyces cinnabarinus]
MTRRRNPTARQVRLGAELRKLREAAGLKAREAAALLGADSVQMSQIESGVAGVSETRVRRLAAHYSCSDVELIDALVAMATERVSGWWEKYQDDLPTPFLDLPELEHHARYRWDVDFLHIPGLLQTEGYARALFAFVNPEFPASDVERWVEHRMKRRTIIERPDPVPYETLIHEAALRIRVGDRAEARAQLVRILELSGAGHVTVRVIPFELDGFGGAGSAMVYAAGPVPQLDTMVRDSPSGPVFVDAAAQLTRYRTLFRRVEAMSLEPGRSRDFIHRLTKEL